MTKPNASTDGGNSVTQREAIDCAKHTLRWLSRALVDPKLGVNWPDAAATCRKSLALFDASERRHYER